MKQSLVITSIASDSNPVLRQYAEASSQKNIPFIVIGDTKSPDEFSIEGCDFYSIKAQADLNFSLAEVLPTKHYARKNLGYLIAMKNGSEIIIETDDDNIPYDDFWFERKKEVQAYDLQEKDWVNVYGYFSKTNIWPRGFALERLKNTPPELTEKSSLICPIQQGLADEDPDVDAIYRLAMPLPIKFDKWEQIALGNRTICPFNSQNTTWFKEAFPLMYLPSFCSFRMTDIWRSFVAQRVSWECGWSLLFHNATVWQERNDHDFMIDFRDEVIGYENNLELVERLKNLDLKKGVENIEYNMIKCYDILIEMGLVEEKERPLLKAWFKDLTQ